MAKRRKKKQVKQRKTEKLSLIKILLNKRNGIQQCPKVFSNKKLYKRKNIKEFLD